MINDDRKDQNPSFNDLLDALKTSWREGQENFQKAQSGVFDGAQGASTKTGSGFGGSRRASGADARSEMPSFEELGDELKVAAKRFAEEFSTAAKPFVEKANKAAQDWAAQDRAEKQGQAHSGDDAPGTAWLEGLDANNPNDEPLVAAKKLKEASDAHYQSMMAAWHQTRERFEETGAFKALRDNPSDPDALEAAQTAWAGLLKDGFAAAQAETKDQLDQGLAPFAEMEPSIMPEIERLERDLAALKAQVKS